ncbi:MAG: translation initiation factor IF-2 [Bacteroidetes bacterium]|nr:translation initiation factor IF-2 [Bacteroidota bacterium]MDA1224763.1 translation initiation factor IF-2 [Bacteroidota bacterium]
MAEYRLAKVATELNRSFQALADLLNQQGFDVMPKPTTKITEDMYQALLREFSADKAAKDEAKLLKSNRDPKPTAVIPVAIKPKPAVEVLATVEPKALTPESIPQEKMASKLEELAGPKILREIDIGKNKTVETSPVNKKTPVKEVVSKPVVVEKPIEAPSTPVVAVEVADPVVETPAAPVAETLEDDDVEKINTKFETLSGPKVLGKINLPTLAPTGVKSLAGEARDELREKRKRKRKQAGTEKVAVQERVQIEARTATPDPNRPTPKAEITKEAVQQKVRNTMGQMGNAGKTRGMKQKIKARNKELRANDRRETNIRKEKESKILKVTEFLTANELATMMNIDVTQVISTCFMLGVVVSINQRLDAETIQIVSDNFGFEVEFVDAESQIEPADNEMDNEADLLPRAPIVTVMGHVDHGKTSLLDYIRKANVIAGEAGGITQHIGAYEVSLADGKKITFLDTPGHEAFTAMRARGAKVTDMAIIVIAADDSVMPQTREAIAHAQAANIPMVFAFNKIDKEGANADKIREQLSALNILVEDWGGKFQCQEISAKKGLNVEKLLEKVLLEAEMMDLKANPNRRAKGTVIEATQEKGRGIVCSMLVQTGTLHVGDHVVVGPYYAKVRALYNERGGKIDNAPPSTPVKMLGFSDAPTAGDAYVVFADESEAKTLANKRLQLVREQGIRTKRHITLDEIGRRLAVGNFKELKLIVKGDVDGSVEALADSLMKLTTEEIAVTVIFSGVGQITESDVLLASASDAIIVGFQVRPSAKAKQIAENEEIDIRTYSVIYQAIDEIKLAMEGMLSPEVVEKIIGNVEIREVFKISKVGTIAGCYVTSGIIERKAKLRVIRDGVVIHTGELSSLKRFKDDVKDVTKGYECGLQLDRFNDIEVGDYLEIFKTEEVKRKL